MMNRRGFLGSLGALAVAPFVPAVPTTAPYVGMVKLAICQNTFYELYKEGLADIRLVSREMWPR